MYVCMVKVKRKVISTCLKGELIGDHVNIERQESKRKWQTDSRKEEGKQSSNPRRERERESWEREWVEGVLPVGVLRSQ